MQVVELPALDHRQRPPVEPDVFAQDRARGSMLGYSVAGEVVDRKGYRPDRITVLLSPHRLCTRRDRFVATLTHYSAPRKDTLAELIILRTISTQSLWESIS